MSNQRWDKTLQKRVDDVVTTATQTAIDAKVTDAIANGVTTIAPSQNAVFDALALKQPLDGDLTTIAGLTATTDNFMVASASAWASRTPAQAKTSLALVKADVGLGSVVNADTTTTTNITDATNKRFITDAQQTVLGNTSGTNTGDQSLPTDATISTTDVTTNNASTTKHGWLVKATAPAANTLNVVGIANTETVYTNKLILDAATTPSTQAFSDAAAIGTSLVAAHADHKHAMMAAPTTVTGNAGTATKWATARNLAGNSVDGSIDVAFANKVIVQGTTDAGLSAAQFLGALATGIVKNTTTTGVLSIAVNTDIPVGDATHAGAMPTPPNDATKYLRGDATWTTVTATAPDIALSLLAPSLDETITAGYSAHVSDYYEIASGKFLEAGLESAFEIG